MFISLGMFVSSLLKNQLIAGIVTLVLKLIFVIAGVWQSTERMSPWDNRVIYFFSVPWHFENDFARGVLDTRHLVLYASLTLFGIFLTIRSLESRRWR
jgi:ABC-2 type transport system permease protein